MLHRPTGRVNKPAKVASAGPQRSVKEELILWGSERWMLRSCRERKKTLIEGKGKKKKTYRHAFEILQFSTKSMGLFVARN